MRKLKILPALFALLLLCGCGGTPKEDGGLQVCFFSAGKADAILLTTENGAVLIDAGERGFGQEILAYLEARGITALDYLIITHFDKDHVGGAAKVINGIPVAQVLQSNCPKESSEYERYLSALNKAGIEPVTVREDMSFALDGVSFTVDPPEKERYAASASNNSSLIVTAEYGSCRLLFMGDAENARLEEFIAGGVAECGLIKMPHHGNWHKPLTRLLELSAPDYAVISSLDDEPESEKTVALLESRGVEIFYTRLAPVLVSCDGEKLSIRYEGEGSG